MRSDYDWLVVQGRWVVLASIIVTLFLPLRVEAGQPWIIYVTLLAAAYNAFLLVWLRMRPASRRLRTLTVVADLLLVSRLVMLSGGIRSPFFDVFFLVIIAAALQHSIAGGLLTAAGSLGLVLAMEVVTESGRARILDIDRLVATVPHLFLVAIASGFLARQLAREADRRRNAEVQARELELEQARIRQEMEVAKAVHMALLPSEYPKVAGIEIAAGTLPAREIGGDLYGFIPGPSESLIITIMDVSGKGVPAALALSGLKTELDRPGVRTPIEILEDLNRYTLERTPEEMFATMAMCVLDPHTLKLQVALAGHEPVLLARSTGEMDLVKADGLPLGVSGGARFSVSEVQLRPGDLVVLYTDGFTEARCDGRLLQIEGVAAIVSQNRRKGPAAVLDALFQTVHTDCVLSDDATAVVVGASPEAVGS